VEGYPRWEVYPGVYMPPWVYIGGVPTMVYTLLHPPGYTIPLHRSQHLYTARTGRTRLTALEHSVAEVTISDEGFTVAQRLLPSSHPFHCWSVLERSADLQKKQGGRRACCAEWTSLLHTRFTVGLTVRT